MLPDFPKSKAEISKLLSVRVRRRVEQLSPFASLPKAFIQHEGHLTSYPQDGFGQTTEGFEHFEVPIEVKVEELRNLVGEKLLEKIDAVAEEMARKTSEHGYRVLDKATEKAGNVMNANGEPFDPTMFLAMLEKVDITFDSDGKPDLVVLMHPEMLRSIQERLPGWDEDPLFKKRYEELLASKKEVWLDRESNRKLVD